MSRVLWIVQTLLAAVFLLSGGMKLVMPPDVLAQMLPLPGLLVRLIGLAETLGAIGLILPGLLRIRPGLTPLAAAGLVLLMTGATVLTPTFTGELAGAALPLVLGLLSAFVLLGRSRQVGYKVRTGWRPTTS
jgi:hypothetical protein